MKIIITSVFMIFFSLFGNGQDLAKHFDSVTYDSNSCIIQVFSLKKGIPNGYSIKFDSTGHPIEIGKFQKGMKKGEWFWSNGCRECFQCKYEGMIWVPGCGTGILTSRKEFQQLYEELTRTP